MIAEDGSVVHRTAAASSASSTQNSESSSLLPKSKPKSKTQEQSRKSNSIFIEQNSGGSGEILVRNTTGGASSYYDRSEQITQPTSTAIAGSNVNPTSVTSSSAPPISHLSTKLHQQQQSSIALPSSSSNAAPPPQSSLSSTPSSSSTPLAPSLSLASPNAETTQSTTAQNLGMMTLRLDQSDSDSAPKFTIQAIVNDNTANIFTLNSAENPVIEQVPVRIGRKNELLLRKLDSGADSQSDPQSGAPKVVEDQVTWVLDDANGRTIPIRKDLTLGEEAGEHREMSSSEGTRVLSVINKTNVPVLVRLLHDTEEILSEILSANSDAKLTQGEGVLPRGRPGKRFKNHLFYLSIQQPMMSSDSGASAGAVAVMMMPCVYNLPDSECDVKVRIQSSQEDESLSLLPIKKAKKSKSTGSTRENVSKEQLVQGKLPPH